MATLLATGAVSILSFGRDIDTQPWLDRLILTAIGITVAAGIVGLGLILTGARPSDALHVVYGVLPGLCIAAGRYLGRQQRGRSQAAWVLASVVLSLGILARLAMTA